MRENLREKRNEIGVIKKKWKNRIPVCVVYPDSYFIGMSNLALHVLYETLNGIENVVCERAFFEKEEEIRSFETKKSLLSFEILFFTISYELNYLNIVPILEDSGISVKSADRRGAEPLIIGGGITLMANPEPVSEFFDLFILGDIEATILEFMGSYSKVRKKSRKKIIETLSHFSWVYNPSCLSVKYDEDGKISSFEPTDFKIRVEYYKGEKLGHSAVICKNTEFSDMYLVEGTRGCPSRCPFCLMGNIYTFRIDRNSVLEALKANVNDVGLIGGGVSFLPDLLSLITHLKEEGKRIHLPSLRLDKISYEVLCVLKEEVKTLTFGVEAGSFSMRVALGKPLTDDEIYECIERILDIGTFNFKLYFMIGLPGEKMEDVEAIFELTKRIRHIIIKKMAPKRVLPRLTIHVSPFVPKPKTPLQWVKMEDIKVLEEKIKWLKNRFKKLGGIILTHESVKHSFLQGVFARGDRRLGLIIRRISSGENIRKIMLESAVNLGFYVWREREREEIFPWDFIDTGRTKEELYREFNRYISVLKSS